jgi:phage terminase large subunit GpA-like protein
VANEPASILVVLPTESDCRDYVVSDVEPIFEATPALRGSLTFDTEGLDRNTLLSRRFPGGSLKIVAAKAPRNLRRHTARVLIVDEADAMEAGAEGNPIRLAERRTLSFANRKIVVGSTPIFEDVSPVIRAYTASDQRVFEVPCPSCGTFVEIMPRRAAARREFGHRCIGRRRRRHASRCRRGTCGCYQMPVDAIRCLLPHPAFLRRSAALGIFRECRG